MHPSYNSKNYILHQYLKIITKIQIVLSPHNLHILIQAATIKIQVQTVKIRILYNSVRAILIKKLNIK
jgi:hypothetical protein